MHDNLRQRAIYVETKPTIGDLMGPYTEQVYKRI